jgi:hypothetical protein
MNDNEGDDFKEEKVKHLKKDKSTNFGKQATLETRLILMIKANLSGNYKKFLYNPIGKLAKDMNR